MNFFNLFKIIFISFYLFVSLIAYSEIKLTELPDLNILWRNKFPEKFYVGDRITFELEGIEKIEEAKILKINFLALMGNQPTEVINTGFILTELKNNENPSIPLFEIIMLTSQAQELPPLILYTGDGKPLARTRAFPFQIHSAFENPGDPKEKPMDYIPPVGLAFPRDIIIFLALTFGGALLIGGFFVFRKLFKKKKKQKPMSEDHRRPDEKLLDDLKEIEEKKYISNESLKKHYLEVSDVFKNYLAFRYKINVRDATTEETINLLQKEKISESFLREIKEIFVDLDKVKFARYIPSAEEALKIVPRVREYIYRTRIRT